MARESDKKSVTKKAESVANAAKKKSAEVIQSAGSKTSSTASSTTSSVASNVKSSKPDPVVIKGEATTVSTSSDQRSKPTTPAAASTTSSDRTAANKGSSSSSQNKKGKDQNVSSTQKGSSHTAGKTNMNSNADKKSSSTTSTGSASRSASTKTSTTSQSSTSSSGGSGSSYTANRNSSGGGGGGSSKLGGFALGLSALSLALGAWLFNRTSVDSAEQVGATSEVAAKAEAVNAQFSDVKSQVASMSEEVTSLKDQLASVKTEANDAVTGAKAEAVDQINEVKGQLSAEVTKIRGEDLAMLQKTQADRTEQVGEVRAEVAELSGSVEEVYAELDKSLGQWQLQEVEQLMVTANDRLNLEGDVGIAQKALQFADERMRDMKDPALADVRGKVANDLSALAAVEQLDVAGVAARIRTLAGGVDGLKINRAGFVQEAEPAADAGTDMAKEEDAANESGEESGGGLMSSLKGFGGALVSKGQEAAKKLDEATQPSKSFVPPLAPDQKYFLVENLRLQYTTAQLALFERDQDTYASSLSSAAEWVGKYFEQDSTATDAIADAQKLAETNVNPELPDISGSLQELRQVIQSRKAQ